VAHFEVDDELEVIQLESKTTHNKRAKEVMEYGKAFVYIP
jgi:tryptophan synthase alpha subunit